MKKILITILLLTSAVLANAGNAIVLKQGDSRVVSMANTITKVVNSNRQSVVARKVADNKFSVTALSQGTAYVYVWDINNQQAVTKVIVHGKSANESTDKKITTQGSYELYFKLDPQNQTPVNQKMLVNKLRYNADLGSYGLDFGLDYKYSGYLDEQDVNQLDRWHLRFAKGHDFLLLGDSVINYTEITAPFLEIQGFQGYKQLGSSGVGLSFFSGKRTGELWGGITRESALQDEDTSALSGLRVDSTLASNAKVGLTYLSRSGSESASPWLVDTTVVAADGSMRLDDYTLRLEAATNQHPNSSDQAILTSAELDRGNYGFGVTYRDVGPAYTSVSDYLYYRGAKGLMLNGRYTHNRHIGFNASFENYLQRFDQNFFSIINEDYEVQRSRFGINVRDLYFVRPSLHAFNSKGYQNESSGFSLLLDQIPVWNRDLLTAYFEISPYTYQSYDSIYFNKRTKSGLQARFAGLVTLRLEHVSDFSVNISEEDSAGNNPRGYNFIARSADFKVLKTNILSNVSYWFRNRLNSQGTIDKNQSSVKLALREAIGSDLFWYLNFMWTKENSLKFEYEERIGYFYEERITQSEISGGFSLKF